LLHGLSFSIPMPTKDRELMCLGGRNVCSIICRTICRTMCDVPSTIPRPDRRVGIKAIDDGTVVWVVYSYPNGVLSFHFSPMSACYYFTAIAADVEFTAAQRSD